MGPNSFSCSGLPTRGHSGQLSWRPGSLEWTFSCSVSPSWRSLFPTVASVPTYLRPQRAGVPLPREQRCARLRESAPAPAQSLPGSVSGLAPPLRPLRVLGDPSWREWDAVAHGTALYVSALFRFFFLNSEKKCQLHLMFWKPFQCSRKHARGEGVRDLVIF